jgi:hypothetical protein
VYRYSGLFSGKRSPYPKVISVTTMKENKNR